jgi:hypothetical protein
MRAVLWTAAAIVAALAVGNLLYDQSGYADPVCWLTGQCSIAYD